MACLFATRHVVMAELGRVVGTSDDEEAVGFASSDDGPPAPQVLTARAHKRVNLFGAAPRRVWHRMAWSDASDASEEPDLLSWPRVAAQAPKPALPSALSGQVEECQTRVTRAEEAHARPAEALAPLEPRTHPEPATRLAGSAGGAEETPALHDVPPTRHLLRARKPSQLHPYTVEALRYRRELYENDWQDAVVSQREWRRNPALRDSPMRAPAATQDSWLVPDDADVSSSDESDESSTSSDKPIPPAAAQETPPRLRGALARRERRVSATEPTGAMPPEPSAADAPSAAEAPPSPASSDSTDYERRFRMLKRMMPAHMARACIDDLRAMRHGEPYADADTPPVPAAAAPPTALQPGESRRRMGSARAPLLSASEQSESSDSLPSATPEPLYDGDLRQWYAPRAASPPQLRDEDAIDRMLSRAPGPRAAGFGAASRPPRRRSERRQRRPRSVQPAALTQLRSVWTHDRHAARESSSDSGSERVRGARRDDRVYVLPGVPDAQRGLWTPRGEVAAHARLPMPAVRTRMDLGAGVLWAQPARVAPTRRVRAASRLEAGGVRAAAAADAVAPAAGAPCGAWALPPAWAGAPHELHAELHELLAWDAPANVRLDLGIAAPALGTRFAVHTDLARGRLHVLLHPPGGLAVPEPATCHVWGHTLSAWMPHDDVAGVLAELTPLLDASRTTHDLLHFLSVWFTFQVQLAARDAPRGGADVTHGAGDADAAYRLLMSWAQGIADDARTPAHVALAAQWFRVQIAWRARPALEASELPLLDAAHPLVLRLLAAGLPRTLEHIAADEVSDYAAEVWVSLIHVLGALGDADAVWDVLNAALDDWDAAAGGAPLARAERTWYVIFAVHALARFSAAAGVAGSHAHVAPHWPTVQRAVAAVRLRFDERVEGAAPRTLLRRRDAYIHVVLRRCHALAAAWSLEDADVLLKHLFDVFDAHRLADLPTETDHDFAPFLRTFDAARLTGAAEGTAYNAFLQLLGRASAAVQRAAPGDAARRLSRLFSRMTPVRVMPFTRGNVPVSTERAVLYNHYSLVMLFLFYVPSSALQRLRQIRSFLPFATADRASQVACIRAMVYAGTLCRHHGVDLAPVVAWLVDVARALMAERAAAAAERYAERRAAAAHREAVRMVAVLVRSVQHLVAHAALSPAAPPVYPPSELLHPVWTHELLQSPLADERAIVAEVLRLVEVFLQQRAAALADAVDELDELMADPSLAGLLGETAPAPARDAAAAAPLASGASTRQADAALAQRIHSELSPALFAALARWLRTAPAAPPGSVEALVAHAEADEHTAALVRCWAACAHVCVVNGVRHWASYLTLGHESWRRLDDAVRRRDIALRFVVEMARLDPPALRANAAECLGVWFGTVAAREITLQPRLTALLADAGEPLLRGAEVPAAAPAFGARRVALLTHVLSAMDARVARGAARELGFYLQCVSALLSSLRAHLEGTPPGRRDDTPYGAFCADVCRAVGQMSALVRRGIGTELHATAALVRAPGYPA